MKKSSIKQDLQSFSQTRFFLKKRIGLMTFYDVEYSKLTEMLILFLEYSQLISQVLLVCSSTYTATDSENDFAIDKKFFFDFITYSFKLTNPSFLISFQEYNKNNGSILGILIACTILKFALLAYITFIAYYENCKGSHFLIMLWKWIYRLQTRVLCFFVTSFWLRSLLGNETEGFRLFGMGKIAGRSILSLLIPIEYIFSAYMVMQFCYRLPTKNFLSSKSFNMELLTLAQKLVLQIVHLSFRNDSIACAWVFTVLNLFFCMARTQKFYRTLPLYNLQALRFKGDLVSIVNSLSIACIFQTLLRASDYNYFDSNFVLIIWIILSILMVKLSRGYLNQLILGLLTRSSKKYSPELLVHKICLTKQLREKVEVPGEKNSKYQWSYLLSQAENAKAEQVFGVKLENDLQNHQELDTIFLRFLDNISTKYPNNSLIKLHIADICAKKPELYARTIKISSDLAKNLWSKNYITFSFLLYKIENSIIQTSIKSDTKLDLFTYVKSQIFFEEFKNEISKQTQLTIDLCKNIVKEVTEIGTIFNYAQEIHKFRIQIQKKMLDITHKLPEHFIEPLKICADYHLSLNFSFYDYQKYIELYTNKLSKCEKYFKAPTLIQENLYQDTNAFVLLSGQRLDNGKITFCTKSLEDICGAKKMSLCGSHIYSLFTSSFQNSFVEIFRQLFDTGKTSLLNKTIRAYLYHKDGYIREVDFYLRIHPYVTENLFLNMLIRPTPSSNEYLLLRENGDIEGATKNISQKLGLTDSLRNNSYINIKTLSEELWKVNEAFNIANKELLPKDFNDPEISETFLKKFESNPAKIFSPTETMKSPSLPKEKAIELYHHYSLDPQKVSISPFRTIQSSLKTYDCRVSLLQYGPISMKLISIDESTHEENQYQRGDSTKRSHKEKPVQNKAAVPPTADNNISFTQSENFDFCEEGVPEENYVTTVWRGGTGTGMGTDGNLLSPRTSRSQAHLLTSRTENKVFLFPQNPVDAPMSHTARSHFQNEDYETPRNFKIQKLASLGSSTPVSQGRPELRLHKAFQTAINTKSYPKVFNALCFIFFVILLGTLCSQVLLKTYSDSTYQKLVIKKDMLIYAQYRTFYIIRIQTSCRGGLLQVSGFITAEQTGNPLQVTTLVNLTETWTKRLSVVNQNIIDKIDYLDQDIKDELFKHDVTLVGSYTDSKDKSTTVYTSFQAIDEIQTVIQRLTNLPGAQLFNLSGYYTFNYLTLNTLNDIVYKNLQITNLFLESVNREKDSLQVIMILCITIIPVLLVVIAVVLISIIWKQYALEKKLMKAFVKLNPQGIKNLLENLTKFKKRLDEEESFQIKSASLILKADIANESRLSSYHKQQNAHLIKYSETQKKYWTYTVKVSLYMTLLLAIIIANFVSAQNSVDTIYKRQTQLQFANQISVTATLCYISFTELFTSNNTNTVNHMLPYDSLVSTMAQTDIIQSEIADILMENNNEYDPEIKQILSNTSACAKLDGLFSTYCDNLEGIGQFTGMNYVLALFSQYMRTKPQDYLNADKSTIGGIIAVGLANFDILVWSSGVASAEAQMIGEVINSKLTKNISDANTHQSILLGVFVFSLVVVSGLIWKQILTKLREVNNQFKRVLQVFPPDFVLSSFLLKNFLMESSMVIQDF